MNPGLCCSALRDMNDPGLRLMLWLGLGLRLGLFLRLWLGLQLVFRLVLGLV